METVYLIMSNNGQRTNVKAVVATLEKTKEVFDLLDSCHSENLLREEISKYNIKYFQIKDEIKTLYEHLFIEKREVMN